MKSDEIDRQLAEKAAQLAASEKTPSSGFERVHFPSGTVIFAEGADAEAAYLIANGKVELWRNSMSDAPQSLGVIGGGDIFGELALFDDSPRLAEARAVSDVEAICISRDEFLARLDLMDPVMKAIVLYMVKRERIMSDDLTDHQDVL